MKIGDRLYKYQLFGRYAEYICTGIVTRESSIQYEMECQACTHGYKCKLLVKESRIGEIFEFLQMVNDEDEEWEDWHVTNFFSERYFLSLKEARLAIYKSNIEQTLNSIKKTELMLEKQKQELKKLNGHYLDVKESSEEGNK